LTFHVNIMLFIINNDISCHYSRITCEKVSILDTLVSQCYHCKHHVESVLFWTDSMIYTRNVEFTHVMCKLWIMRLHYSHFVNKYHNNDTRVIIYVYLWLNTWNMLNITYLTKYATRISYFMINYSKTVKTLFSEVGPQESSFY